MVALLPEKTVESQEAIMMVNEVPHKENTVDIIPVKVCHN